MLESFLMKTILAKIVWVISALFPVLASGQVLKFDSASGRTEFVAIGHPSALKIHGRGPGPVGEIQLLKGQGSGKFTFDLSALETGIGLRDRHMKEKYLEIDKSDCTKTSTLEVTRVALPSGWKPGAEAELPFEGKLTLHCASHPVKGTVCLSKEGDAGVTAQADFEIKLTDFAITIPSYMGITVADSVKVSVETHSACLDGKCQPAKD